jgi:hypothetical protein
VYRSVTPLVTPIGDDMETARRRVGSALVRHDLARPGAVVVLVSASQDLSEHQANFLKLHRLDG